MIKIFYLKNIFLIVTFILKANSDMNITMENIYIDNKSMDMNNYNYKPPQIHNCQPTQFPSFMYFYYPKVTTKARQLWVPGSRSAAYIWQRHEACDSIEGHDLIFNGHSSFSHNQWSCENIGGLNALRPQNGWFHISIPGNVFVIHFLISNIYNNIFRQAKFGY